jgi:hypothetical protein
MTCGQTRGEHQATKTQIRTAEVTDSEIAQLTRVIGGREFQLADPAVVFSAPSRAAARSVAVDDPRRRDVQTPGVPMPLSRKTGACQPDGITVETDRFRAATNMRALDQGSC